MLRRRFVWRRFVEETFCRGDVLCADVLYVRRYKGVSSPYYRYVCDPETTVFVSKLSLIIRRQTIRIQDI
jgi:hypothetical protein